MDTTTKRYAELVTERTVERFLARLFLRDTPIRALCIVAPFISPMAESRFSLAHLRKKIEADRIQTYVITREPKEDYQRASMEALQGSPWIEIRYNASLHAKIFLVQGEKHSDSYALFGSGNLTSQSIERNIEVGMMIYGAGPGRTILDELHYHTCMRLRTLPESNLIQSIRSLRRAH